MKENSVFDIALIAALAAKEAGQTETAQALLDLATALYINGATDILSPANLHPSTPLHPDRPLRQ